MKKTVTEELEAIAAEDPKGMLYPDEVLRFAKKHKDRALHGCLEWDGRVAADAYRIEQIRRLAEGVLVNIPGEGVFPKWVDMRDPKLR